MSTNEQINDLWEKYVQDKKSAVHRSVDEHNNLLSSSRHAASSSSGGVHIMDIELIGNPNKIRAARRVTMEDLFNPDYHAAKGPIIGGGKTRSGGGRDRRKEETDFGDAAGQLQQQQHQQQRPTLAFVFEEWPQIKEILWNIVISRISEIDFPYLPDLFLDHFENTLKTGIASKRAFHWEEMELVMSRFLESFLLILQEERSKSEKLLH